MVRHRHQGFTLLEILVVIIVIGLLASIAVLNTGDAPQRKELENQVRRIFLTLQTASDQAILDNRELGLRLDENRLEYLAYDPEEQQWSLLNQEPFQPRQLPGDMRTRLETDDNQPRLPTRETNEENPLPDIVLFSSGETSAFTLELWSHLLGPETSTHQITGDGINSLEWRKPHEEGEAG